MPARLLALAAFAVLGLAACDTAETERPDTSSFEATVSGSRVARLEGHAWTNTYTLGAPTRQFLLDAGPVGGNEGGVSLFSPYDTALVAGTYPLRAGVLGLYAYLTLPVSPTEDDPSTAETFYAFDGTLTLAAVTPDSAVGTFRFRAGPLPGSDEDLATVEGRFVAAVW